MKVNLNYSWIIAAATRYGKDELERRRMHEWVRQRNPVLWLDPQGTAVRKFLLDLYRMGRTNDVIWINLRDTDVNVGFNWIEPCYHPDLEERNQENTSGRERLKKKILARAGEQTTMKTHLIDEWMNPALDLMYWQKTADFKDYWVLDAFRPGSDAQRYLLANLQDNVYARITADKIRETWEMSQTQRRETTGPAWRRNNSFFGKACVMRHTGASINLNAAFEGGKIILVSAKGIEDDEQFIMYQSLIQKSMDYCRARAKKKPFLKVVCNEATRYMDLNIAESFRLDNKEGISYDCLVQNPLDFTTEQIRNEVFGNSYQAFGRLNNLDAAEFCGKKVGTRVLDDQKEHYRETRYRQVTTGFDYIDAESVTHGADNVTVTRRKERVPVFGEMPEEIIHKKRYEDQLKEPVQDLLNADPGQFHFCDERATDQMVYVPMLPEMFPGFDAYREKLIDEIIAEIKTRPEYRRFVREEPPCLPMTPPPTKKGNPKRKFKPKGMR